VLQDCGRIPHCGLSIETRASGRYDLGLVFPDNADFQGALDMGDGGEGQGLAWERGYRSALVIPSAVSGGSGCLDRLSASLSGLPPGLGTALVSLS
jgi:hypothetical protein